MVKGVYESVWKGVWTTLIPFLFDDDDVDSVRCELRLTFGEEHLGRYVKVQGNVAGRYEVVFVPYTGT